MNNKRVGIVTYFNYNYGSTLQCFSTFNVLRGLGFSPILLIENAQKRKVKNYIDLLLLLIFHPFCAKRILKIIKSSSRSSVLMARQSLVEIEAFINQHFNKELVNKNTNKKFLYFLTGSDQVWNGYRCFFNDFYFLRFANKNKRNSWAASFGGNHIASYNKNKFKRYIKAFNHISLRENEGMKIIKKFDLLNPPVRLCDPVFLFSAEEWNNMLSLKKLKNNGYIFVFFLDEPIDSVKKLLSSIENEELVSIGYCHKTYSDLEIEVCNGGPDDFLSLILHSKMVLTDSFHATAFSLIFHKDIYSFSRNHTHSQNQSTRILNLFADASIEDRFDNYSLNAKTIDYKEFDSSIEKKKQESLRYLQMLGKEYEN